MARWITLIIDVVLSIINAILVVMVYKGKLSIDGVRLPEPKEDDDGKAT